MVKMRTVVGKDGRTYRVPDNRGGKATRGASGASKGSASKGSKGSAGAGAAAVYEVEEWRGKGRREGGVISRHKTLAAAKRAAHAHAKTRDKSWRIEVHHNEPRHAGESSKGSASKGSKGAGSSAALESRVAALESTTRTLTHHVGAHDLALSALARAAEARWSVKVPGYPKRGRS